MCESTSCTLVSTMLSVAAEENDALVAPSEKLASDGSGAAVNDTLRFDDADGAVPSVLLLHEASANSEHGSNRRAPDASARTNDCAMRTYLQTLWAFSCHTSLEGVRRALCDERYPLDAPCRTD